MKETFFLKRDYFHICSKLWLVTELVVWQPSWFYISPHKWVTYYSNISPTQLSKVIRLISKRVTYCSDISPYNWVWWWWLIRLIVPTQLRNFNGLPITHTNEQRYSGLYFTTQMSNVIRINISTNVSNVFGLYFTTQISNIIIPHTTE